MWIIQLGRTENYPHFCKADADLLATMPRYYKLSKFGLKINLGPSVVDQPIGLFGKTIIK